MAQAGCKFGSWLQSGPQMAIDGPSWPQICFRFSKMGCQIGLCRHQMIHLRQDWPHGPQYSSTCVIWGSVLAVLGTVYVIRRARQCSRCMARARPFFFSQFHARSSTQPGFQGFQPYHTSDAIPCESREGLNLL